MSSRPLCCVVFCFASLLGVGCGDDDPGASGGEVPESPRALVAAVESLQRLLTADPALGALAEVDRAINEDKPVLAAQLLDAGVVPATRSQIERIRELELPPGRARGLQDEAVTLYEARLASLELYARALERGMVEDLDLLTAISAQREAEQAIGEYLLRLEAIRPVGASEGEGEGDEAPRRVRDPRESKAAPAPR